jgi:hypothetical protein
MSNLKRTKPERSNIITDYYSDKDDIAQEETIQNIYRGVEEFEEGAKIEIYFLIAIYPF